jgi:hypothetical protein
LGFGEEIAPQKQMSFDELNKSLKKKDSGFYIDFFDYHIWDQGEKYVEFGNTLNTLEHGSVSRGLNQYKQVPDSSWFTNRQGKAPLSIAELQKGANENDGPSHEKKWLITKGKIQGRSPGFYIEDARGDHYIIKLDMKDYPEMASGAEVISSKFFYAIGYNVPQYTIAYFKMEDLEIKPGAKILDEGGFEKPMTVEHLQSLLNRAYRNAEGQYRASASLIIKGSVKGPFSFHNRRKEDPEDIFSHRYRREIRALRVFSAWLNHNDVRRGNTLDVLVTENGRSFLKHYLIDFGSTLGSQTIREKWSETSREYIIDPKPILLTALTLGIYQRPWLDSSRVIYPSVGYITSDDFDPKAWKQEIPNFAFSSMTPDDAAWAAGIVCAFSDEDIRALVETGQITDPQAREYLIRTIIARRDRVVSAWGR